MITKEMIDRINFLARKSKNECLSEEEKLEQQQLRRQYLDNIKGQVKQQLECIEFVEDKKQKEDHVHHHNCGCDCGCKKN